MPAARKAIDLFLNLGVSAGLLTAGLTALPAAQAQHHHGAAISAGHTAAAEGGEGGEGGEGADTQHSAGLRTTLELQVALAQMQGHLLIAEELLLQGEVAAAEPHVSHPVDELYGAVAPALEQRQVAPFLAPLEALRQQVRLQAAGASPAGSTASALESARQAIRTSAAQLGPADKLAQVRELAATAAQEYAAAVDQGRVIERIEYQDARGFLLEAERRLLHTGTAADPATSGALLTIRAMLKILPTAQPPARALATPAQLQALQESLPTGLPQQH